MASGEFVGFVLSSRNRIAKNAVGDKRIRGGLGGYAPRERSGEMGEESRDARRGRAGVRPPSD